MSYCAHCGAQLAGVGTFCQACGKPHSAAPPIVVVRTESRTALIVILLVVVVFIGVAFTGIIAAIAVPNLLTAIDRSKQKRTMVDLRTIGTAVEQYATDHNAYPGAADLDSLRSVLVPEFATALPARDGWDNAFHYACWNDQASPRTTGDGGGAACNHYRVSSAGKDGVLEHDPLEGYEENATQNFNCDIVFENGRFVQYPAGIQT